MIRWVQYAGITHRSHTAEGGTAGGMWGERPPVPIDALRVIARAAKMVVIGPRCCADCDAE